MTVVGVGDRAAAEAAPRETGRHPPEARGPLGEEIFRSLCEALPVGVVLTNAQGRGVYANGEFRQITGFGVPEMVDGSWAAFVHHEDAPRALATWREALETARPTRLEFRV